jgi:uncharacterized protein (DUF1330 family)
MPRALMLVQATITDPAAWGAYAKASGPVMSKWGAELIVKPDSLEVLEGQSRPRVVVFAFESMEKARGFWNSPEYAELKAMRIGAGEADFLLLEEAR